MVVPVEKGTVDSTEIIQDKGMPLTRTNTCKVMDEQNEADLERLTGNAVTFRLCMDMDREGEQRGVVPVFTNCSM